MSPRFTVAITIALVMLAGCTSVYRDVAGEKLGAGHCRQAGVIEAAVRDFRPAPNATLSVRLESLRPEGTVGNFHWLGVVGADGRTQSYRGAYMDPNNTSPNRLVPGENRTFGWPIPDYPLAPWKEFWVSYSYRQEGRDRPTSLVCSLEGDDAPWAFENKTAPASAR